MKLELKNIGGFKEANIEINGITVIAGNNNTGKSTIGKTLFLVFNSLYNINSKIEKYRVNAIEEIIQKNLEELLVFGGNIESILDNISLNNEYDLPNVEDVANELRFLCGDVLQYFSIDSNKYLKFEEKAMNVDFYRLAEEILEAFSVSDIEYGLELFAHNMNVIFSNTLINQNSQDEFGHIKLKVKDDLLEFFIAKQGFVEPKKIINLNKSIFYIDNPFILDDLMGEEIRNNWGNPIIQKMYDSFTSNGISKHLTSALSIAATENLTKKITMSKKLGIILKRLNEHCVGSLYKRRDGYKYTFASGKELPIANISTGLKVFLIIKTLLLNASIEKGSTLILDEPEIHLHPEWQLVFAEIIVLLQKEFGLHILLTTHSPYFLKAIEKYSYVHGITDKCNYYLTSCEESVCTIEEVTDNTEAIYKKFYAPFKDLDTGR